MTLATPFARHASTAPITVPAVLLARPIGQAGTAITLAQSSTSSILMAQTVLGAAPSALSATWSQPTALNALSLASLRPISKTPLHSGVIAQGFALTATTGKPLKGLAPISVLHVTLIAPFVQDFRPLVRPVSRASISLTQLAQTPVRTAQSPAIRQASRCV